MNRELAFKHRLARDLGMSLRCLNEEVSAEELRSWHDFYEWEAHEHERALRRARRRGAVTITMGESVQAADASAAERVMQAIALAAAAGQATAPDGPSIGGV